MRCWNPERLRNDEAELETQIQGAADERAGLDDIAADREAAENLRAELAEARNAAGERQSEHDRLIRDAAAGRQRLADIAGELQSWQRRLENADQQLTQLDERRRGETEEQERLQSRPAEIATQREALFEQISDAEIKRNQAADALSRAETRLA